MTNSEAAEFSPAWSPDGQTIVFVRRQGGQADLYTMAADGTAQTRLTDDIAEEAAAGWSPDAQKIAFVTFADGEGATVWIMDADGSNPEDIYSDENAFIGFQEWSPDGSQLMLSVDSAGGGQLDLMLIDVDGSNLTPLTATRGDEAGGTWSHDGAKIVYWSESDGPGAYLMNADGSDSTKILEDTIGADTVDYAWSPDDTEIAWTAKFEGGNGSPIFVMNADGSDLRRLTEALPQRSSLDWATGSQ